MFRKQPIHLFILFMGVLLFSELVIMLLLEQLNINTVNPLLAGLLDASAISLLTIITLAYLCKPHKTVKIGSYGLLLVAGLVVFSVELLLMQLLPLLPKSIVSWQVTLINIVLLALLCFPFIYRKVFLTTLQASEVSNPRHMSDIKTLSNWTIGYIYLAFIFFLVSMFLVLTTQKQEKINDETYENEQVSHILFEKIFLDDLKNAILDSKILAVNSDLRGLATAQARAELELQADYHSLLEVMHDYNQLRYIDKSGMELIRVDRNDDQLEIVPQTSLQNKRDRYYFQRGMKLLKGEVYISPLDLNIEHNEIERPFRPMIRVVSPVFNHLGVKQGIIVINLSAKEMLNKLNKPENHMAEHIMLLDSEGYWLHGADEKQSWGFMFEDRKEYTLAKLKPDVWQKMQHSSSGSITSESGTYVYRTISPLFQNSHESIFNGDPQLKPPQWFLMSYIDDSVIKAPLIKFCNLLLVILLLFAALGAFIIHLQLLRNKAEVKLVKLAHFDNLTCLANRTFFMMMLEHEIVRSQRVGYKSALLYLDLDNFKPINDDLGHSAGDIALKETAQRLNQSIRKYDLIARLGGDEFTILMTEISNPQDVDEVAERIIRCFDEPFKLNNENRFMGISIGITLLTENHTSAEQVLKDADKAMYQAKKRGKNCYYKSSQESNKTS